MKSNRLALLLIAILFASCVAPDTAHRVVISVPEQKMAVLEKGVPIATYPVSTSKVGVSDYRGSWGTPLGKLEVASKIGTGYPPGAVFKDRRSTGEIIQPDAPGRDPIVTRILWLRGTEPQNQNAYRRYIYIHGTPEERNIGLPVSYGCIRMRSRDVMQLYDTVGLGAEVTIINTPLHAAVPSILPPGGIAALMKEPFAGAIAR
jgi:lipoprotein-anchoring transpeptidase ErfK/SrfK